MSAAKYFDYFDRVWLERPNVKPTPGQYLRADCIVA